MTPTSLARFVQFAALFLLGFVVCAIIGFAPNSGHGIEKTLPFEHVPSNSAVWTKALAKQFPNCRNIDNRPNGVVPNEVVLIPTNGKAPYREQFAFAWAHRKSGQFFTVGYCE